MKRPENISCIECKNANCLIKRTCDEPVLEKISAEKVIDHYPAEQHIFNEGYRVEHVYFILSGIVKIYKTQAQNKHQIIRFSSEGNILGHRGLNQRSTYPVSAQFITNSRVCCFTMDYFFQLIKEVPKLSTELILMLSDELCMEESKLRDMSIFNVREKVAKALQILIDTFGLNAKNEINHVEKLNRQSISELVGLTPNQLTKVLSDFKRDELLDVDGKRIKILAPAALKEITNY